MFINWISETELIEIQEPIDLNWIKKLIMYNSITPVSSRNRTRDLRNRKQTPLPLNYQYIDFLHNKSPDEFSDYY